MSIPMQWPHPHNPGLPQKFHSCCTMQRWSVELPILLRPFHHCSRQDTSTSISHGQDGDVIPLYATRIVLLTSHMTVKAISEWGW
eukprot:scaffold11876_cov98-Skeletonema_dohrnii-CCMP3373.AAC.5